MTERIKLCRDCHNVPLGPPVGTFQALRCEDCARVWAKEHWNIDTSVVLPKVVS